MSLRVWSWIGCLLLAAGPAAWPADDAASIRIARIRAHMADNLQRLPNYTCTQTIERSSRSARSRRFQLIDTLRLEVALVNGRELFAWPGSGKFDDRELGEIIGSGASGNGNFGLHARSIFLGREAQFQFAGEVDLEDRRVYQYVYRVPRLRSGFKLKSGEAEGIAGYHGRFEAEIDTLDVVSLDVLADDEIPPHVPIRSAFTKMRYRRMTIGSGEFLLPESSELAITNLTGDESRNVVALSGCKQYGTESVISFADPPPEETTPATPPPVAAATAKSIGELPIGLDFEVSLDTRLTFPGAAVGDLVEGRLTSDAKKKGAVMIPKGTLVRGRLLAFGYMGNARLPTLSVTIRLNEIDLPGGRAEVRGVAQRILSVGTAGSRLGVDNGVIYIVSNSRRELARGSRIWWRLEQKTETR